MGESDLVPSAHCFQTQRSFTPPSRDDLRRAAHPSVTPALALPTSCSSANKTKHQTRAERPTSEIVRKIRIVGWPDDPASRRLANSLAVRTNRCAVRSYRNVVGPRIQNTDKNIGSNVPVFRGTREQNTREHHSLSPHSAKEARTVGRKQVNLIFYPEFS